MRSLLRSVGRTWFTGLIALLTLVGYAFYYFLWILRYMQRNKRIAFVCLSGLLLICALTLYTCYFVPLKKPGEPVSFVIEPGTSLGAIADTLAALDIIPSRNMFLLWMKVVKYETKVQAGRVSFNKHDGIYTAARKLLDAEDIERRVTIREGLIIEQTAQLLANELGIDSASFTRICYDSTTPATYNIDAPTLEGYLFPNTYRFPESVSARTIIDRMVGQFKRVYSELDFAAKVRDKYTRHEITTLASIVEKEATVASERTRIAAVFHNRLRLGYPLGADPTVRYIYRKFSGPLRVSELNNDSPYNTRKFAGLPPGPICSPGRANLQAAAKPLETKELYFVAKWDGSGEHDFSITNAEHERKKLFIRKQNRQRLRQLKKKGASRK
ncbi:MAG: endolytic transglycosylase MltG [Chitinivibrionales bacterium]|nr:endolytic transglycosylase MltG [Chitinivibrionales bacterium]